MLNDLLEVIFPNSSQSSQLIFKQMVWSDLISYLQNQSEINTVLTSDSEKLLYDGKSYIESVLPFENLKQRLIESAQKNKPDLIIISHCFFNSGMAFSDFNLFVKELSAFSKFIIIDGRQSYLYLPLEFSFNFNNVYFISQNISKKFFEPFDHEKLSIPPYFQTTRERIYQFRNELVFWDHFYFCEKNIISVNYDYHGPLIAFAMPSPEHALKYKKELESRISNVKMTKSRLIADLRKT